MLAVTLLGCSLPPYAVTGANYIRNPGTNAVPGCNTTAQVATCANYAMATGPNVIFSPSNIESTSWGGIAQAFADNSAAVGGAEVHREPPTVSGTGTGTFRVIGPKGQPFIATGLSTYCEPPGDDIFDVRGCTSSVKAPLPPAAWFSKFVDILTALHIVTVIQDCDYSTTLADGLRTNAEKAYAGWASAFNGNPYVRFASAIHEC